MLHFTILLYLFTQKVNCLLSNYKIIYLDTSCIKTSLRRKFLHAHQVCGRKQFGSGAIKSFGLGQVWLNGGTILTKWMGSLTEWLGQQL